jgi:hypothetical protein
MIESLTQDTDSKRAYLAPLSLYDFLSSGAHDALTEYLSLSITWLGCQAKVTIITTGDVEIAYSAMISATKKIDLQTLMFVAHDINSPIQSA